MNIFESRLSKTITLLSLVVLTGFGFVCFVANSIELATGLMTGKEVVSFDKGVMYLLGSGIGLSCLLIITMPKTLFDKQVSAILVRWMAKGILVGVVIMFAFPQLIHFGVWTTLKSRNYVICHDLGSQWLLHKTFVYANSAEKCLELVAKGR